MKSQFLKMAGVKTDEQFYKKFPSEDSFFKAFPEAREMVNGGEIPLAQFGGSVPNNIQLENFNIDQDMFGIKSLPKSYDGFDPAQKNMSLNSGANAMQNSNTSKSKIDIQGMLGNINKMAGMASPYVGAATDVIAGVSMLKEQKNAVNSAKQDMQLSELSKQAANTREEPIKRQYVRPEDNVFNQEQLYPTYGVGTNILQAEDGAVISEIYDDIQPLSEEEMIEQYYYGGNIPKAASGMEMFMGAGGGNMLSNLTDSIGSGKSGRGPTAGNKIGKGVGTAAGMAIAGPVGGMIGGALGSIAGGLIDSSGRRIDDFNSQTEDNNNSVMATQFGKGVQGQFSNVMQNGGQLGMGGDLQLYNEGEIEEMSYNPYLPDEGQTVMFKGPSHAEGGIPITYGDSPVEVEGGEPAVKLEGEEGVNMVVFGNLKIPKEFVSQLDNKAKNRKFKNYIADLSKTEAKQNSIIEKANAGLSMLNEKDSFDKLKISSLESNIKGADMKLKDIASKKEIAAKIQNAINETADEYGLVADDLARGKYKKAKYGANILKAQNGINKPTDKSRNDYLNDLYSKAEKGSKAEVELFQREFSKTYPEIVERVLSSEPQTNYGKSKGIKIANPEGNFDGIFRKRTKQYKAYLDNTSPITTGMQDSFTRYQNTPASIPNIKKQDMKQIMVTDPEEAQNNKFNYIQAINSVIPYLRPTDVENLSQNQLLGEMYALSNNQVEPVYAQKYNPQLQTPYDISFQDQLNEITAQSNATMRMAQGDPSILAAMSSQAEMNKSKVLGEEFRQNQNFKNQVYNQNIGTLNDAQLKNLNIMDVQQNRQTQARANTKAITQQALNSISAKVAQNQLENRKLQVQENMYNYRFDDRFRARNTNELVDFEEMIQNASPDDLKKIEDQIVKKQQESITKRDKAGAIVNTTQKTKTSSTSKMNGGIVRAIKNL